MVASQSRLRALNLAAVLILIGLVPAGALAAPAAGDGDSLGYFEKRKVLSAAREAMEAQKLGEALGLWEKYMEGSSDTDKNAEDALYSMALIRLSTDPAVRDISEAKKLLTQVESRFPKSDRRTEVLLLLGLVREVHSTEETLGVAATSVNEARTKVADLQQSLEECRSTRQELKKTSVGSDAAVNAAKAEIQRLRSQIDSLTAELKQKDEALAKVTEMLTANTGH